MTALLGKGNKDPMKVPGELSHLALEVAILISTCPTGLGPLASCPKRGEVPFHKPPRLPG